MFEVTYRDIQKKLLAKYGKFFTKPYDLNLFGIRSSNQIPNKFDDTIGCAYTDPDGNHRIFLCPATTDPGLYYLKNPMNVKGTAILKEGYYPGLWTYGKHKGRDAFVQIGKCTLLRDANRDGILDFNTPNEEISANDGINLHGALTGSYTMVVDKFSAGCQVVASDIDLLYLLSLLIQQKAYRGFDRVSYALLNEKDFV